ncbi:SKP1/BTB/POZ domain-containing protein [Tanacetum coccineum]
MRLVSLVGGRKVLAHIVVRDEELKWTEGFLWTANVQLTSRFIMEVEFFDLKTASPKVLVVGKPDLMFTESIHTDITIFASDGSIGAHWAVLAARSPVFDSMFIHDLKEKDSSSINIPDMSIVVWKAFLNYLYSNNIQYQEFVSLRLELLKDADKYDVTNLKDACHKSLIDVIDLENVLERLQTAFIYHLPRLKVCCIEYLMKFGKIFEIKEELNAFIHSADRELVSEVVNQMLCAWKGV